MSRVLKYAAKQPFAVAKPFAGHLPRDGRMDEARKDSPVSPRSASIRGDNEHHVEARERELHLLEQEIKSLRKQLSETITESEAREAEAYDKGKADGASLDHRLARERLDALEEAMKSSAQAFAEKCSDAEVLALLLAQTALEKMFGPGTYSDNQAAECIRYQLCRFEEQNPTRVSVSPTDFLDKQLLDDLAAQKPGFSVVTDPKLRAGECRIALELGEVDVGLSEQWERLRELFDRWAGEYAKQAGGMFGESS